MNYLAAILLLLAALSSSASVIQSTNLAEWTRGSTVGVRGGIPDDSAYTNVVNGISLGLDTNGITSASDTIYTFISAAPPWTKLTLPAGVYRLSGGILANRPDVKIMGQDPTNTFLFVAGNGATVQLGGTPGSFDIKRTYTNITGAVKGSTNITVGSTVNGFGDVSLAVGMLLKINVATRNTGTADFPLFTTKNDDRLLEQVVELMAISGTNLTIWPPLVEDYTNATRLEEVGMLTGGIGLANFTITSTIGNEGYTPTYLVSGTMLKNYHITNCIIKQPGNRHLRIESSVNGTINGNYLAKGSISGQSSHTATLFQYDSGMLFENNIVSGNAYGLECNFSFVGNAILYNFFTNQVNNDVGFHDALPRYNVVWGNEMNAGLRADNYFGPSGKNIVGRNKHPKAIYFKKWSYLWTLIGNIFGNPLQSWIYPQSPPPNTSDIAVQGTNFGPPFPVISIGQPDISTPFYADTAGPAGWNWPGNYLLNHAGALVTNGITVFTNTQTATTNLQGDFSYVFDKGGNENNYALVIQDAANTNIYHSADNGDTLTWIGSGTSTNLIVNSPVTVTNGMRFYIAGNYSFRHFQLSNSATFTIHGNYIYTDVSNGLVWNSGIADHSIPTCLIYSNTPPEWWGDTNVYAWPPVNPTNATMGLLPSKARYATYPQDVDTNAPVALFTGTPTSGLRPLTVTFISGSDTNDVVWNFGNGQTSTAKTNSITYTTNGTYTVSMIASNQYGATTNTKTAYITVTNSGAPPTGTWVKTYDPNLSQNSQEFYAGNVFWQTFTNVGRNTCGAIGIEVTNFIAQTPIRAAIFGSSSNFISGGQSTITENGFMFVPIDAAVFTDGQVINVGVAIQDSYCRLVYTSGNAVWDSNLAYNNFPPSFLPPLPLTYDLNYVPFRYAMSINVTPNYSGATLIINSR